MRWIKWIFIFVLILVLGATSYQMVSRMQKIEAEKKVFWELSEVVKKERVYKNSKADKENIHDETSMENFSDTLESLMILSEQNPDFKGWLTIGGTNIDYPVMMRDGDPEYYLHRDFYGYESYSGTPFIANGKSEPMSPVLMICGHHMKNGSMFSDLLKYRDPEFRDEHDIIQFDTLYHQYRYQIIASGFLQDANTDEDGFQIQNWMKDSNDAWLQELLSSENQHYGESDLNHDAEIIILVTCSYENEDGRYAVIGQLQK